MKAGSHVVFNGCAGVVLATSVLVRRDWEGQAHPEWPPMVRVRWDPNGHRVSWFPPELLDVPSL